MWVGLGLGDSSDEIRRIKALMRQKFSYCRDLADTPVYDQAMVAAVAEMQRRYAAAGKLTAGRYIEGVINLETKYVLGVLPRPVKPKPVLFTVEGHMSSMWVGPCAETARLLEAEGVCRWQPVGYNNTKLPFDNASGERELRRLLADRTLLPPGTPWGLACFSQGAIVGSRVWLNDIRPKTASLHWRLDSWRGTLAFGSPYRERNVVADWIPDPPRPGTQGISNERMTDTPATWKEVARRGDLYTENQTDSSGRITQAAEHKTAIYLAVQNRWAGDPDSLFNQLTETITRPMPELIAMTQAIAGGAMFLGNMAPHGGYDLRPCIDWMRARLTP